MPHSFGYRAHTRDLFQKKFRKHGTLPTQTFLKVFRIGQIVDLAGDGAVHKGKRNGGQAAPRSTSTRNAVAAARRRAAASATAAVAAFGGDLMCCAFGPVCGCCVDRDR